MFVHIVLAYLTVVFGRPSYDEKVMKLASRTNARARLFDISVTAIEMTATDTKDGKKMNSKRGILCPEQTECSCAFILHIATAAYTVPTAAVDTMVSIIFSCRHDSKQMCVSDCSTCELFSDRWVGNSQTDYCQQ